MSDRDTNPDTAQIVECGKQAIYARRLMTDTVQETVNKLIEQHPGKLDVLRQVLQGEQARVGDLHHYAKTKAK